MYLLIVLFKIILFSDSKSIEIFSSDDSDRFAFYFYIKKINKLTFSISRSNDSSDTFLSCCFDIYILLFLELILFVPSFKFESIVIFSKFLFVLAFLSIDIFS